MANDDLLDALDRLRGTAPEFAGFLSNHGPMAADAMIRLGGTAEVAAWVDRYRRQLDPAPPPGGAVGPDNWEHQLGRYDVVGDWTSWFARSIADQGWRAVIAEWWPRLLPGAAASAAHGLLRTAHAVRNLDDADTSEPLLLDELSQGLALWAARYQTLPGRPELRGGLELGAAVAGLPRLDPAAPSRGPGLVGRLRALDGVDALPAALEAWGSDDDAAAALDDLVGHMGRTLVVRPESPIALCHTVTAPAAVRMILPSIPPEHHRETVAACWQVAGAIFAAFASPSDPEPAPSPRTATPADLAEAAIDHGDDHVLKLTEACIRQYRITGDGDLLAAADAFRQRIPAAR